MLSATDAIGVYRVLIVDWDVHAGNGTQDLIAGDDRLLLISIHRYEHGKFWPNIKENNWDYNGDSFGIFLVH